jgi:hypothetical protein
MNIRKNSYLISKSEFDEQIKDEGKLAGINKKIEENTYYKRLIELKINELTLKKQDLNKNSSQIDEENKQLNEQIAQLQDIIDGDGISEENLKFFEGVEIEKDKEAIAAEANQQSEKTDDKAPAGNVSTSGKKGTGTKPSGEKMPPGLNEVDKIKWKKANGYRLNSTEQATLNMIERAAAKEAAAKKSVVDSVDAAAKTAKEYGSAAIRYLGSIGEDSEKNSGENLLPKGIPGQERFGSKTPNPSGVSRIPGSDQFTPIPK